ncbi:MAG: hypothetical protein OXG04_27115 [Acidobacteria bacterium]|nr:hypothetical protein [Acidobacteriota bacterium]
MLAGVNELAVLAVGGVLGLVLLMVHPAYANRHIYTRNDEKIIAVSMDAADYE